MIKQLRYFCTLLLIAVASVAWGDEVTETITFSELGYENAADVTEVEGTNVVLALAKGTNTQNAPKYYTAGSGVRLYSGNAMTVTSTKDGYTISKVVFNFSANNYTMGNATVTSGSYSTSGAVGTWTGNISEFTITSAATCRLQSMEITLTNVQFKESDLTITSPSVVSIAPEETTTIAYSSSSTGDVSWSTNNPNVATVEDGVVTGVATGTATITISQAADSQYEAGQQTVIVKVVAAGEGVWNAGYVTAVTSPDTGFKLDFNTDDITAYYLKASSSNDPVSNSSEIRVYTGAQLTFAVPDGYEMTEIVFTCTSESYATALAAGKADTGTLQANGSSVSWEGVASSVIIDNSSAQTRISKIVVTYGPASVKHPSDFTITSPTTVELVLPDTPTATVTYTTSSTGNITWKSADETVAKVENGVITAVAAGTTTVIVRQDADADYEASEEIEITVNVTGEAAALENIAALTALTDAGEYKVKLADALVTYVNGKYAYIEDASGAVMLYGEAAVGDLIAGDKITGEATVTYAPYHNLPEVTAMTLAEGYTKTTGNKVTPTVVTLAQMDENYESYISRYVTIENATVVSAFANKNSTIQQGEAKIVLRDQNSAATLETTVDDIVTVTAHPAIYNTTKQIAVYEQSQIVVKQDDRADAEIAFSSETLTITQGDTDFTAPEFINPNDIAMGEITFASTNANVASWGASGLVIGTEVGTTNITATFNGNEAYKPATATLVVTVNEDLNFAEVTIGSGIYKEVTSASELEAGKRYLIVYNDAVAEDAYIYAGINTEKHIGKYVIGQISDNKIDINNVENAVPIVLQKSDENWYLLDGNNFLAYTRPVNTTSNNYLYYASTNVNGTEWAITTSSISNVWNSERNLRFNTTSGQERFCAYLATGSQQDVVLYKEIADAMVIPGDVNKDGQVTVDDLEALVKILLGTNTAEDDYNMEAADVNGDEEITVADVSALVGILLGGE
ncbi:MAG: Ig-like domain-containing protein [Prevotella sp.]|nr:Ig-like domain-containing protein [Prevotella sp.]